MFLFPEYQAMQQSGATAFAIQAAPGTSEDEIPQIMIEAPVPTSTATVLASADMTSTIQTGEKLCLHQCYRVKLELAKNLNRLDFR